MLVIYQFFARLTQWVETTTPRLLCPIGYASLNTIVKYVMIVPFSPIAFHSATLV